MQRRLSAFPCVCHVVAPGKLIREEIRSINNIYSTRHELTLLSGSTAVGGTKLVATPFHRNRLSIIRTARIEESALCKRTSILLTLSLLSNSVVTFDTCDAIQLYYRLR
jgi:hypothetical protein